MILFLPCESPLSATWLAGCPPLPSWRPAPERDTLARRDSLHRKPLPLRGMPRRRSSDARSVSFPDIPPCNASLYVWHGASFPYGMAKTPTTGAESPSPSGAASPAVVKLPFGAATYSEAIQRAAEATISADLAGGRTGWSQLIHCRFLARLGRAFDWNQPKAAGVFAALLGECGAGGNASQFRQWLERPAPKGPALLDPQAKVETLVSDF